MSKNEVQEIQGLYGSFSLSERVLQKIWLNGDFNQNGLNTASGKALRILSPGRWNMLEGPDFLEAKLEIDGQVLVGDVEVHFYATDWQLHDHGKHANFDDVRLHVVLYPERTNSAVLTSKGIAPELLCLMPLLERDLEDFALDAALMELEQVEDAQWVLEFMGRTLDTQRVILRSGAEERWARKIDFAKKRLLGASWEEACHQFCLEVFGYARNRVPMSRLALNHSIEDFSKECVSVEALFDEQREGWRLNGLRPANHPKRRLAQYAAICQMRPDWPERLQKILAECPLGNLALTTSSFRKTYGLPELIRRISTEVFDDEISAKRLNTLICDALLPLAQAACLFEAKAHWLHWPVGDSPTVIDRLLKQAQIINRSEPFSNGQLQGSLHLLIKQ